MCTTAVLVHKIVYLALPKTGVSSSSVSSAHAALGVVLVPAAAAGEGTAWAAGAEAGRGGTPQISN